MTNLKLVSPLMNERTMLVKSCVQLVNEVSYTVNNNYSRIFLRWVPCIFSTKSVLLISLSYKYAENILLFTKTFYFLHNYILQNKKLFNLKKVFTGKLLIYILRQLLYVEHTVFIGNQYNFLINNYVSESHHSCHMSTLSMNVYFSPLIHSQSQLLESI